MGYTLIINPEPYVKGVDREIQSLKERGYKYFFRMGQRLHRDVLTGVREYCKKNNYRVIINPCKKMQNAYEIIIFLQEEALDNNQTM
jgi:hypothetical protein